MSDDIMSEEDLKALEELEAMMEESEVEPEPKPKAKVKTKAVAEEITNEAVSEEEPATDEEVEQMEAVEAVEAKSDVETLKPSEIKRDLAFNENTLSEAFTSQAALYFHYASIAQKLGFKSESLKSQLDILESKIDHELRESAAKKGTKITEAQLGKQVKLHALYSKKVSEVNEAKAKAALAKDVLEAFKQKRDMLVQMGADMREEMKGQLRMRGDHDNLSQMAKAAQKKIGA